MRQFRFCEYVAQERTLDQLAARYDHVICDSSYIITQMGGEGLGRSISHLLDGTATASGVTVESVEAAIDKIRERTSVVKHSGKVYSTEQVKAEIEVFRRHVEGRVTESRRRPFSTYTGLFNNLLDAVVALYDCLPIVNSSNRYSRKINIPHVSEADQSLAVALLTRIEEEPTTRGIIATSDDDIPIALKEWTAKRERGQCNRLRDRAFIFYQGSNGADSYRIRVKPRPSRSRRRRRPTQRS